MMLIIIRFDKYHLEIFLKEYFRLVYASQASLAEYLAQQAQNIYHHGIGDVCRDVGRYHEVSAERCVRFAGEKYRELLQRLHASAQSRIS
jgi:hypothetical protein